MKTISIQCSEEEYSTIYTALRLELERNWGRDEDTVNLLKEALSAVKKALN